MITVAVIPARGGSKGIPLKNLERVGGRSLVRRAIESCLDSGVIDRVCVSTDDPRIAEESLTAGAEVIDRPSDISGDTASSESALLHGLNAIGIHQGVLVFPQCTSPFLSPGDIATGVRLVSSGAADSVFSAVRSWDFLWQIGSDGSADGLNHDMLVRLRRQELPEMYRETGGFYVMDIAGFLSHQHRFFGTVRQVEVDRVTAIDIDEPADLVTARAVEAGLAKTLAVPDFSLVKALVMDFDGVHTDDSAFLNQDGSEEVRVSRADGMGVKRLREAGVPMLIVSSEVNPVVLRRAEKLGIPAVHGTFAKRAAVVEWLESIGVSPEHTAYVGNDVNDLECLSTVGTPIAVANAVPEVIDTAVYVTRASGGGGAIREIAELMIRSRSMP